MAYIHYAVVQWVGKQKKASSLWFQLFNDGNDRTRHETSDVALQEHMNTSFLGDRMCCRLSAPFGIITFPTCCNDRINYTISYNSGRFHTQWNEEANLKSTLHLKSTFVFQTNTWLRATVNIFPHVHVAVTLYMKYKNTYWHLQN